MSDRAIATVSLLVPDYGDGIDFYVRKMGFALIEDRKIDEGKQWVVVAPNKGRGCHLLLAKASTPEQRAAIGNQTGGRVFLFLETDDFERDHRKMIANNIPFLETPWDEPYGRVAVFADPFGNKWDLIQRKDQA